jgi:hypothetical protein
MLYLSGVEQDMKYKRRKTMLGILTRMLSKKYIEAGYRLTEDEDFLYLYVPDVTKPYVFSAHGATLESVEAKIETIEAEKEEAL